MSRFPTYILLTGVVYLFGSVGFAEDTKGTASVTQTQAPYAYPPPLNDDQWEWREERARCRTRLDELSRQLTKACGSTNTAQCKEKALDCASSSGSYSIGGGLINVMGQMSGAGDLLSEDDINQNCYSGSKSEQKSEKESLRSSLERMQDKAERTEDKISEIQKRLSEDIDKTQQEIIEQQRDFTKEQRSARRQLQQEQDDLVVRARELRQDIVKQQADLQKATLALAGEQKKQAQMAAAISKFAASSSSSVKCAREASESIQKIVGKSPKSVSGSLGAANVNTNKRNQIFQDMVQECLMMIQQQREDALNSINDKITSLQGDINAAQMALTEAKGELQENTQKLTRAAQEYQSEQLSAQQNFLQDQARLNDKLAQTQQNANQEMMRTQQRLMEQKSRAGEVERNLNIVRSGKTFGETPASEAIGIAEEYDRLQTSCNSLQKPSSPAPAPAPAPAPVAR